MVDLAAKPSNLMQSKQHVVELQCHAVPLLAECSGPTSSNRNPFLDGLISLDSMTLVIKLAARIVQFSRLRNHVGVVRGHIIIGCDFLGFQIKRHTCEKTSLCGKIHPATGCELSFSSKDTVGPKE